MNTQHTIDRLEAFIDTLGISTCEFERSIEVRNGYIGKQINRKGSIGSHIIERILNTYPQLNVVWLMTGRERMHNAKSKKLVSRSKSDLRASA